MTRLLGFPLRRYGLDGLLDGLLVSEEFHGDDGLHVLVEFVHEWDAGRQVEAHDGLVRHAWEEGRGVRIGSE